MTGGSPGRVTGTPTGEVLLPGGRVGPELTSAAPASDNVGMTLLSEPAGRGRHRAPEPADVVFRIADHSDLARRGRHAEPAWVRELFDPKVDEDPFDWLGFIAEAG